MLRKILAALVLGVLAGCTELPQACREDSDCGSTGTCRAGMCFFDAPAEVDAGACSPECAAYQACIESGPGQFACISRYERLVLLEPADGSVLGGGPVQVRAQLEARAGVAPNHPSGLSYRVVRSDGGTNAGSIMSQSADGGTYVAQWSPPAEDGVFLLTAAHPVDGGPSATVQVSVDTTPPSLVVQVPAPQRPASDGGFTYEDPNAGMAWRRDQVARVRVESDSMDLEPTSLGVVVRGHDGGSDLEGLSLTPVTPCARAFCGEVEVPLWQPGLPAFRGSFTVAVTARDRLGNEVLRTGSIPVTRWKWAFNGAAGPIESTPAIGQLGTVYFGTNAFNGKVFALTPEGTKKWETQLGEVAGSPAVGTYAAGAELVYVGANNAGTSVLYALGSDGGVSLKCPGAGATAGEILTAVAITDTQISGEAAPIETAIALANNDSLLSLRPSAVGATRQCTSLPLSVIGQQGGSLIAKGADIYLGSVEQVLSYRFSGSGWGPKPGFNSPATGLVVTGLGFASGDRIVGTGGDDLPLAGGVFSFLETDGSGLWKYPDPFTQSAPVRNMSIGAGNTLFFGRESASGTLTAIDLLATAPRATAPDAGSFPGAPALGASGTLYAASSSGPVAGVGEVSAWNATSLENVWRLSDNVGRAEASPALDCSRNPDGSAAAVPLGALYVPSVDGRLYAFVVDSRGLDTSAPWPKYQHDARNTGNPSTPISSCP